MWFPGSHHMVSNVGTMWFSNGRHVFSMLTPHGFHVDTTSLLWFPHDFHRWKCHIHGEIPEDGNNIISMGGNDVISQWKPHGFHVLPQLWLEISLETTNFMVSVFSLCHVHGFHMDIMCDFKCRHPVVSTWTPYGVQETCGFQMYTIWCPGNHMETNTRKSSA